MAEASVSGTVYVVLDYALYTHKEGWEAMEVIGWRGTGCNAEVFNNPNNTASGDNSHAEGSRTTASGTNSHAEGANTTAKGSSSHAEGLDTIARGEYSHAEGGETTAWANYSHAEGYASFASGYASHAEGETAIAYGRGSHAEGEWVAAVGYRSHAEGSGGIEPGKITGAADARTYTTEKLIASPVGSVVLLTIDGVTTCAKITAFDKNSKTMTVDRSLSAVEVNNADIKIICSGLALGNSSHAEGNVTIAKGNYSHAEGNYTTANSKSQHVQGEHNIPDTEGDANTRGKYAHIVGNGTSAADLSNAHTIDWEGNAWYAGGLKIGGTSQDDENAKEVATKEYVDSVVSSGGSGGTMKLPYFDLGALGLPATNKNTYTNMTGADVADIITALENGPVLFGIPVILDGHTMTAIVMGSPYYLPGDDSCFASGTVTLGETYHMVLTFSASDGFIQLSIDQIVRMAPGQTAEVGQFLRVASVNGEKTLYVEPADMPAIPTPTESDYGKVLTFTADGLAWVTPTGGSSTPSSEGVEF